jgi:Holliday junction resolvase RusA-like endonuclease
MTQSDKWNKRPAVVNYYQFKDDIRQAAAEANFTLGEAFEVEFVIPMPTSWSTKKKDRMAGKPHKQKPDLDNLTKALKDALAKDDSYIWRENATKVWGHEGHIIIANIENPQL